MARPPKAGLDYFPHDTDAVNDPKLQALMAIHGPVGYSFYFILLERIFRTDNGCLAVGKLMEKAGLSKTIGISMKRFDIILADSLEIGCFYMQENCITSNGIQKRLSSVLELREKERKRKEEYKEKIKEKVKVKVKTDDGKPTENLRKTKIPFKIPDLDEVRNYCLERKNNVNAEKWYAYYSSNGWKVGKNSMKDWKAAIITWENNDKKTNKHDAAIEWLKQQGVTNGTDG